jgi:hypothetical protein
MLTREIYSNDVKLRFLAWAPHLAVLNHPYIRHIDTTRFLKDLNGFGTIFSTPQVKSISYIIIHHLLHVCHDSSHKARSNDELDKIETGIQGFQRHVPLTIYVLVAAIRSQMRDNEMVSFKPPRAENLPPVKMFSHLLLPFKLWYPRSFTTQDIPERDCLTSLAAGSYFEDGEWTGGMMNKAARFQDDCYSSITSVSFKISDPHRMLESDDDSNSSDEDGGSVNSTEHRSRRDGSTDNPRHKLHILGSGRDKDNNSIKLFGEVYPAGLVRLKMINGYSQVRCTAQSTFWGICGHIDDDTDHPNNWLWLWKKEWSL